MRIFREERFDVVHTHTPKPGVLGRIAARLTGVPRVINTVHGFYASPGDPLSRTLPVMSAEWVASKCSDVEFFVSREDLQWARRLRVGRRNRMLLLRNGVDLERFPALLDPAGAAELKAELGIPGGDLVVTTVGRMVREKGIFEFIDAARMVRSAEPGVTFVVVGPFDADKDDALSTGQAEEARGDVIFAGWREDVAEVMAITDVFVLASWREGMPLSAIEAAASGVPSVLTDIRGCREVVRNGIEGRLVPPRASAQLGAAIHELVCDPGVRKRMGEAARARAEKWFDQRRVVSTVVRVTNGPIDRRPSEGTT